MLHMAYTEIFECTRELPILCGWLTLYKPSTIYNKIFVFFFIVIIIIPIKHFFYYFTFFNY